jgi:hypothetical protein
VCRSQRLVVAFGLDPALVPETIDRQIYRTFNKPSRGPRGAGVLSFDQRVKGLDARFFIDAFGMRHEWRVLPLTLGNEAPSQAGDDRLPGSRIECRAGRTLRRRHNASPTGNEARSTTRECAQRLRLERHGAATRPALEYTVAPHPEGSDCFQI